MHPHRFASTFAIHPFLFAIFFVALASTATDTQAQTVFQIDSIGDDSDDNPGDGICLTAIGDCTLRAAIEEANAYPNGALPDSILFTNAPVSGGQIWIDVINYELPAINDPVIIDGTTASGEVVLDGINNIADEWQQPTGLELTYGSDGSKIRGLSVINFPNFGISVRSDDNIIASNLVGTTSDGLDYGNDPYGIYVAGDDNLIGRPGHGNVVAFTSSQGIYIHTGSENKIQGNFVGTNTNGDNLGNYGNGIFVSSGSNNIVGGPTLAHGNIVGFNENRGIYLYGASDTIIRNNYVGTDHDFRSMGNGQGGIEIIESDGNTVGGNKSVSNVIGFNYEGVVLRNGENNVIRGNYIGTNDSGDDLGNLEDGVNIYGDATSGNKIGYHRLASIPLDTPKGNVIAYNGGSGIIIGNQFTTTNDLSQNTIRGNQIYGNAEQGIDLSEDGPTLNDADDADEGPNTLLNHPDIDRAFYRAGSDAIIVEYSISSDSTIVGYPITVDVYLADDSTSGEVKAYIGTDTYTTQDQLVQFEIDANSVSWASTDYIVLTATDTLGNTSEFSPPVGELGGPGNIAAVGRTDVIHVDADSGDSDSDNSIDRAPTIGAYPNPFNPVTTVTLTLAESGLAQITVHDMLGRQVATIHDGELLAGITHAFTFDASNLASGAYLLRITGIGISDTKRITLLK